MKMGMIRRLRPLALNLSLVVASLGIAGLLAELAVRVVAPQQLILIRPDLWQPADTVGWTHRPSVSTRINTGERTVSIHTDEDGFRVGSAGRVETDGLSILLLGDSFIEALQVEYEESVSGLLEARLPDVTGTGVAVRNAAVGGWNPDQYLLRARSLLERDDYDFVLTAVYLGNDVISRRRDYVAPRQPVRRYYPRLPRDLSGAELTDAFLRPLNDFLEVRSHLYLFFKNRLQTLRMQLGLAVVAFPPEFLVSKAEAESWEITADILAEIDSVSAAHGAQAFFVLIPAPFQVDADDLRSYVQGYGIDPDLIDIDQPNRRLQTELSARGITVLDALPAFREAHDRGERLYGMVDQHFTPAGNALLAELLAQQVETASTVADSPVSGTRPER